MQFLCLGYLDIDTFDAAPDDEKSELLKACFAQCVPFRATGKVVAEEGLQAPGTARSIRPREGKPSITNGPFVNSKEQLGAYFIIEAETIEEAVEVASLHPAALLGEKYGFGIEVRPIQ